MTIIVENGTIVANANSYVSEADLTAFASARGITLTADEDQLLIEAMDYIEPLAFKGLKRTRDQSLEWPRVNVFIDSYWVDADQIPQQLKDGLCQAAIAIDQGNSPLQDQPRKTTSETVGSISVTYSSGSSAVVINKKILNTLNKLLEAGGGGNNFKVGKG